MFNRYKEIVFGNDNTFDVQKRVFLLITHISIIIGLIGVIVDIVLNLGYFLTIVTAATVLVIVWFHISVRNTHLSIKHSLAFFPFQYLLLVYCGFTMAGTTETT